MGSLYLYLFTFSLLLNDRYRCHIFVDFDPFLKHLRCIAVQMLEKWAYYYLGSFLTFRLPSGGDINWHIVSSTHHPKFREDRSNRSRDMAI